MKTRSKILIDKIAGAPLVYVLNALARLLGRLLGIDHRLDKPFKTIVIAKYVGLGSIIQATPLIQTLRKKFPEAKLVFVTTGGGRSLLEHIPQIDRALVVSDKNVFKVAGSTFTLLRELWKLQPDLFIDLEFYSNYSSIVTTLSKATNRIGFFHEGKIFRKGMYNYLVPFDVNRTISHTYLQFAELVHCTELVYDIRIDVKNTHWNEITAKTGIRRKDQYIIVNPNASDLRLERRWPKHSYISVINSLLPAYPQHHIVLIGDKSESAYVTELMKELIPSPRLINTAGKLSLPELIDLTGSCALMLTNDTGPMHIAFAAKVPTVSLFGPCSPLQYGGTDKSVTLYHKIHCSPCVHKHILPPCRGDNQCMKRISVSEVLAAVQNSL